jgi:hypothetical protein
MISELTDAGGGGDGADDASASDPSPTDAAEALDSVAEGSGNACDRQLQSVRIAELLVDPEGADEGGEYVELLGPPGTQLDGALLVLGNGATETAYREIPLVGVIPDNGRWVIGGDRITVRHAPLPGTIQNGPDGIALFGCGGEWLDGLSYGGETPTPWGTGAPATVASGAALVACPGVVDDDRVRWMPHAPSPGIASTPEACTPCVPLPPGSVLLHEVRYDPPGADGAGEAEFVEVFAKRSIAAGSAQLVLLDGRTGEPYHDAVALPAVHGGRYLVVGGGSVWPADVPLPRAMQNGPDALAIWNCAGEVVDALAYGDGDALGGEGAVAPGVRGASLGRPHGAADTNDNAADFRELLRATPGAPNVE